MNFKLSKFEKVLSVSMMSILIFSLSQIISSTKMLSTQTLQHQASVVYADELLKKHGTQQSIRKPTTEARDMYTGIYNRIDTDSLRRVSADAYLVADIGTGDIYAKKNMSKQKPIASITKLLTALTANSVIDHDDYIAISAGSPITTSDYRNIHRNANLKAGDALFPLLMESNNAVAHSIAEHYGTANFLTKMVERAQTIGMTSTELTDASGISAGNISTAQDLFTLAQYIYNNSQFILDITALDTQTVGGSMGSYTINNRNHFSSDPNFIGGKTGYTTAAKQTMLSIFKIEINGEQREVAIIILGSNKRKDDVMTLYNWLNKYAQNHQIGNKLTAQDEVTLISGPRSNSILPES
ncbi:MAG: hypothetical protein LRZ97_00330 [Candidatus Pacebacteria bacterium]|nr:hypothetical protein [Candidatus Paceibacterota bacterium]